MAMPERTGRMCPLKSTAKVEPGSERDTEIAQDADRI
jgi:hypothetical protein